MSLVALSTACLTTPGIVSLVALSTACLTTPGIVSETFLVIVSLIPLVALSTSFLITSSDMPHLHASSEHLHASPEHLHPSAEHSQTFCALCAFMDSTNATTDNPTHMTKMVATIEINTTGRDKKLVKREVVGVVVLLSILNDYNKFVNFFIFPSMHRRLISLRPRFFSNIENYVGCDGTQTCNSQCWYSSA